MTALLDPATHLEAWTLIGTLILITLALIAACAAAAGLIITWHRLLERAHQKDPEGGMHRLRIIRNTILTAALILTAAYTHALTT